MGLGTYRRKRDFRRTPEPSGGAAARRRKQLNFVVQKHAARRLHYDFRLEMNGVLTSWAVPRGPSLDPSQRRLAVQVEDHPLEYGAFEGNIPEGEYGAGAVLLWDRGSWSPEGDPTKAWRSGKLKFRLKGKKLKGGWMLVRMRNGKNWLLIKERDESARAAHAAALSPKSVKSGKTLEAIARKSGSRTSAPRQRPGSENTRRQARHIQADKRIVDARGPEIGGVHLTHADRVLYPEQGVTKIELARYYEQVADEIIPFIERRPLTLVRCPQGQDKQCFYQRHTRESLHPAIRPIRIKEKSSVASYISVESLAGLVALVQLGALELHIWGARQERIDYPDQLVFDLDPDSSVPWEALREAALAVRARMADLGLSAFAKSTGGKGLHVVVPLVPRQRWDFVKGFAKLAAQSLAREQPDRYTTTASKAKRKDRIFIDYLRNSRSASSVCPYSTRARPGAPIAAPLCWDELVGDIRNEFTIRAMPDRLSGLPGKP